MKDTTKIALAAGVASGYVLGRAKKGRLALAVATYLVGRRNGLSPRRLAAEGAQKLGEVPQVGALKEQLGGDLLGAGKKAAGTVVDRKLTDLAGTLHERTLRINDRLPEMAGGEEEAEGEAEDTGEEKAESRKQSATRKKATAKASPPSRSRGREKPSKPPAGTPAGKGSSARRSAARKSGSGQGAASAERSTRGSTGEKPSGRRR
ncbi:histone protein [Streptomyces sp. NPDC004838]